MPFSDCTAPFTVTFVTDSPGAEIIAGTGAGTEQRGNDIFTMLELEYLNFNYNNPYNTRIHKKFQVFDYRDLLPYFR